MRARARVRARGQVIKVGSPITLTPTRTYSGVGLVLAGQAELLRPSACALDDLHLVWVGVRVRVRVRDKIKVRVRLRVRLRVRVRVGPNPTTLTLTLNLALSTSARLCSATHSAVCAAIMLVDL